MKKSFLLRITMMLLTMLCTVTTWADTYDPVSTSGLSSYDLNAPFGFGAGVTGSEDENPVTVTTLNELTTALSGTDKKTIYVDGTITFTGRISVSCSNKTIYGLPGATLENTTHVAEEIAPATNKPTDTAKNASGILTLSGCSNIIIRNLTFKSAGAYDIDGYDNLTLSGCSNIWVDHCDFQDGVDGNLDCNNASDNICVSWCRFRYLISPWSGGSGGSNDHRFSNLWGGGDKATSDEGKLNTTFYACWWDNGCKQRMPRIRYGQVHILNCYYSSSAADYGIGAGYRSNIYVENSKFTISNAWQNYATKTGYTDYNIKLVGNQGASNTESYSGSIAQFVPSYTYTPMPASSVSSEVSNHAGATLMYGEEATSGVYQWKVSSAPNNGGIVTHEGSDLIQIAFGTAVMNNANDWTIANGSVTVTYKDVAYSFDKYATTSNVNGSNSSSLAADGTSTNNYIAFVPKYNGTLIIVTHNMGGGDSSNPNPTWCYEGGVVKSGTIIGDGTQSVAYDGKSDVKILNNGNGVTGGIKISVKANTLYTLSVQGSKARWEGIIYEYTQGTPEEYTVTFTNNDADAYGTAPAAVTVTADESVTIPTNKTLYKTGYTLTGWSDGTTTYAIGANYTPTADVTLNPVFTANTVSMSDVTADKTVTWYFGKSNGAVDYDGSVNANVQQVTIGDATIDLGVKMPGGKNDDRSDEWMNNQQKNMMVPVIKGAVVTAKVYYTNNASFNGEEITYDADTHGAQGNVVYTYTYTGDEPTEIAVNVGNQFLSYISVTYPTATPSAIGENFKDFSAIVNNQTGTLLTSEEQVQGTAVSFGIAVDGNGTVSRVAVDDASSIATISGKYYNDHGMTEMSVVAAVPGKVTIQIGTCTYSGNTITVKNSNNETVLSYTPTADDKKCWKNDHSNIIELLYEGNATTLTISGMDYCPFVAISKYVEPAEFKDFSAILNDATGTLLTADEISNTSNVNFGIAVDDNGNTVRVAADDASSIATISGKYHNDHGMTSLKVVVPVPGKVLIQIGKCTYSTSTITVKNSDNETVLSYTPTDEDKQCWKDDHSRIIELKYNGPATTLTITGMDYCPFIAVKKVKTALEKSLYSTDFSEWYTFGANTSTAFVVNKVTNFTEENFTISSFNTALTAVTDTKFQDYTELPHNALQAAKAANPYVTVSALANITKVRFIHGATGSNRGWKLEAKGDGDADWVTISDSYANPAAWCEVTKDVNRNNCQLRFTNLTDNQNAYMFELEIFGEVELTMYDITGTISGGNIDGSTITLTGNGETFEADVVDGNFTASVPAGTYTISLSDDVPFLLVSPTVVEVTEAGNIGTINIEAATAQTVSGAITNAPAKAFTLTFTGNGHTETLECAAGATSFSKDLMPDTYVISTNVGTLSPLSQESFKIVKAAITHNIYFPETVPAATEPTIIVDNTITTETANNYKSVTNALAAAKAGNIAAPIITLTSGQTYLEQVTVDQPDVTFTTTGTEKATITFYYGIGYSYYSLAANGYYDRDRAMTRNSILTVNPARWGATVRVTRDGDRFKAENIIFENSFNQRYTAEEIADGVTPKHVGDATINYNRQLGPNDSGYKAADSKDVTERAAAIAFDNAPEDCELYDCEFRGSQDTFYTSGQLYVKNCSIWGNTDYIFGGGYVVFDNCDLVIGGYSDKETSAYITAYKDGSKVSENERYVFRDCTVKSGGRAYVRANLGRDWGGAAASVYYFNLKNEIGNKLLYTWNNMGGGVAAGTANLHIYDFDPTVNANYSTTGSTGANINGLLSYADALSLYAGVVEKLGFPPKHIYDDNVVLDEASYYNVCRIAATDNEERTVELTRSIGADKWNTIVLPFDLTEAQVKAAFGNDVKVAALTTSTSDNLKFSTATNIVANQPYAIKVKTAVSNATFDGVTVKYSEAPTQTVGDWQFVGTYTKGGIPEGSYFFSSNMLYHAADATNTIKAFRGWFTYTGATPARQLTFSIDSDSETTGISEIENSKSKIENYYNLNGQRVEQPTKGLYIVNGKKIVIK